MMFWEKKPDPHQICRVGRGAGALRARGAKKLRPLLGRGGLQNVGGAEIQNSTVISWYQTRIQKVTTTLHCASKDGDSCIM